MRLVYRDTKRWNNCIQKGFTFIELMIVVVILGILAMIVVPRVSRATDEAREVTLATDLTTLRKQIELYKAEHFDIGPQYDEKGNLAAASIVWRMTYRTDPDGKINAASGTYGPYIKKWPANPFLDSPRDRSLKYATALAPPRDGTTGWYLCTSTGVISANSVKGAVEFDPVAGG